jgi:thiol:disulfide interchange protein DsbD
MALSRLVGLIAMLLVLVASPAHVQQQILVPEQAFRIQSRQIDPSTVVFYFSMQPGYVLYHDRFKFSGADIERVELPTPESRFDRVLGKTVLFYGGSVSAKVVIRQSSSPATVVASAQGCAQDIGVCYPPVSVTHRVSGAR